MSCLSPEHAYQGTFKFQTSQKDDHKMNNKSSSWVLREEHRQFDEMGNFSSFSPPIKDTPAQHFVQSAFAYIRRCEIVLLRRKQ